MQVKLGAFWQDWGETINVVWENLKAPTQTYLKYSTDILQAKYAAEINQSYADAQRAKYEAEKRVAESILAQQQQQSITQKLLSIEAWKKATPYVIPIAAGLAIVALLLLRRKK